MNIPSRTLKRVHPQADVAQDIIEMCITTLDRAKGLSIVIVLDLLANSQNKAMAVDCLMFLLRLTNKSQQEIANEYGVSRQATHTLIKRLQKGLGLPNEIKASAIANKGSHAYVEL